MTRVYAFAPLMACLAFVAAAMNPARADEAAEAYVQGVLDEAGPILDLADNDRLAFFDGIENLVDKYVDMRRVGRFVLGQYARQMTPAQEESYFPLFKKYATQIYQSTLDDYVGQRLKVIDSIDRSERDIVVRSKIVNPAPGDPLANTVFHWRVYRERSGAMTVVDAGADNIWLAIEQRSQFTSIIANNGGGAKGIDALIAQLRKQTGS